MRKIYAGRKAALLLTLTFISAFAFAQPTVFYTNLTSSTSPAATNFRYSLTDLGAFRQTRFQTTAAPAPATQTYAFHTGTPGVPDYSNNWRPYNPADATGIAYALNTVTVPSAVVNSARYNSGGGGTDGNLAALANTTYYTINIQENAGSDNLSAIWSTTFNPVTFSAVTQSPIAGSVNPGNPVTVSFTASVAPGSGENVYVRYSTNGFVSSSIVQATFVATAGTAIIPGLLSGNSVSYYIFSSNRTAAQLATIVGTAGIAQAGYDMATLNLQNNGGANYSYTVNAGTNPVTVNASGGILTADYGDVKQAFDAINAGTHTGTITVLINANTTETVPAVLNASGSGAASYTSIAINPAGGGARTISGAIVAGSPMIDFNGADNVTVNGLNSGGNSLTISNTTVSATSGTSTIRFQADATSNTITNCSVLGSSTMPVGTNGGNIWFGSAAITTGNDNNTVSNCNIGPAGANLPTKGVYFSGTSNTLGNNGNTITGNNIFDYFNAATTSAGVYVTTGTPDVTVTNNKFYQTATRTQTTGAQHSAIWITNSTSVLGHTVTGNTIGFATNTGTGTYNFVAVSSSSVLIPIFLSVGTTVSTSVQGNTIAGIAMSGAGSGTSSSAIFRGIYVSGGLTNIGDVTGNTIGSQSATGSITYTSSSTSASDVIAIFNFGSSNWITNNNTIGGITAANSSTGASNVYGLRCNTTSTVTWTCINNTVGGTIANSLQSTSTATGTTVQGIKNDNPIGTFTSNIIRNLTAAGGTGTTSTASVIGIGFTSTSNQTVSQNTISNLTNTNTTAATVVTGIQFTGSTANIVERNFIHSLTSSTTSTTAEINGIRVAGGTTIYRNNMIAIGAGVANAIGGAATNSSTVGIAGINEALGTNSFFHNSVYIGGTATAGAGSSYAFNGVQTTNTRSFRDNIFFNARSNSGATGKHYAVKINGTAPNPAGLTINNNVYFANGTGAVFGFFNSADVANLAAWKTAVGQDANSYEGNPQYLAPTASIPDLHIDPVPITPIEGNGADVGVTLDYDGQTRSGLTPVDIGADAGNFTGADLAPPAITYTSLTNTISLANRTTSSFATITDASGVNITPGTAPRIYYKKLTDANVFNDNTSATPGWKYAESPTGSSPFDFTIDYSLLNSAPVIVGDTIQYFVVAQDLAATPNVGINSGTFAATPTSVALTGAAFPIGGTINRYAILPSISGTITVPGSYASLTNVGGAFQAINSAVVTGNVVIEITADLPAESGTVLLEEFAGPHTITIKPTGAPRVITGSSLDGIIKLNGADRVTIDGSLGSTANTICPPSTATRDLTIINTNAATASVVIWVKTNIANGAANNTVKNCNIYGSATTQTLAGIFSGSSSISLSSLGTGNNNNTFENNNIRAVQVGIYSQGASAANKNTGNIIKQNVMNFPTGSSQNIRLAGVFVGFENNITITGNTIASVAGASTADGFGIACGSLGISTSTFTGNEVINATIAYNKIDSIRAASTFSSSGIYVVTSANAGTNLIANNTLTNMGTNGTSGDFGSGIFVGGGAVSTNVYHNSVSMSGTFSGGSQPNFALAIGGSNPVVNIRNNALAARAIIGSAVTLGLGEYAIGYAYSTFTNLTVNNNDYFTSGAEAKFAKTGSLAAAAGTDVANLAALQTATSQDAASISADPLFNSLSNLQPQLGSPLVAAGAAGTGITDDILCVSRGATPTIGAYETAVDVAGPVITYTALANTCALGSRTLTATITDPSGVPTAGAGLPVLYWRINAGAWNAATGAFISGNNYDFTFGSGVVATDVVQYYIVAQDAFATPNVSAFPAAGAGGFTINPPAAATPPTTPSSYTIQTTLAAGTYTVGGAGTYPTLTAAIAAYNTSCLGGAIVFELLDATYTTPAETFPITINANADASSSNTLTIRPASAVTANITGASTVSILKLNGADYVTIDGSNNGSASRDLTITNTTTGSLLWIGTNATAGATNNVFKNTNMVGPGAFTGQGILAGSGTTFGSAAESGRPNSNNTIQNCTAKGVQNAVFTLGDATTPDQNWLITQNSFGSTIAAEKLSFRGIAVQGAQNFTITNNTIQGVVSSASSSSTMSGILLGAVLNGGTVSGNNITDIKQVNTGGWGSNGILLTATTTASGVNIFNNFISDVASYGFADVTVADNGYGIMVNSGGGYNIYHNTVSLATNQTLATGIPAAINISSAVTTASSINLRDNIFSNAQTVGTNRYSIYCGAAASVFAAINYNDYDFGTSPNLGFLGGNRADITAWRTATGSDANSISITPSFASASDLHLFPTAQPVFKAGTPIAGIGVDYDNNARNLGLPTIGADEIYIPDLWSGAVSTVWDGATTGNWDDGVVPAPGNSVTIPFGVPNMPAIAALTTINNITFVGTGATLSLNGQNLLVGGTITGAGTLTGSSTSNLNLFGTTTVNFTQTNASTRSLNNLTLQGGGPANVTLGSALDVFGTIQLVGGATLNMAAQAVTLKSNATNTARIADLTGQTLTGATNVTMERFIKLRAGGTGRAYRLLTPTVNTSGSMNANWMEGGMNTAIGTNVNPVPGYGTQITGAGGNANGFDKTITNAPSVYATANGVTPTYSAIGSTSGTLNALTGYFMYVRGDRSMDMQVPLGVGMPTSATTLRATGTILQGTQSSFTNAFVGGGALNLVTNPYPSPIDWSLVQPAATGITGSYTYWDANIGTRGGFATVTTGGVSTPATSATQFIQSGQAFFVESDGSVPTVSIQESHKSAGNNNDVFLVPPPPVESFRTELYFTEPNGFRRIADGAIAVYDNKYSTAVDASDAKEIGNWDENIAISRDGKRLAIEARPVIGKSDDLPIYMNNMKQQAYEFEFTPLVFTNTNLKAELIDNYLGTRTLLSVTSPTVVAFTVTADAASKATDRFKVVFGQFGNPMGIDAITVKASQLNGGVQVDWTSKTETDMVRYEVEKSTYGITFAKVNSTSAFGNSTNPVNYNWFDTNPAMGTSFYRIKAIDKAGNVRYSEMVRVLFGKGEPSIVVYPNPVQGNTFKIDMYNLVKGVYVLNLYSNDGRLVYTEQLHHDGSQATRTITIRGEIGKGAFQLQLNNGNGFKTTQKIIKN